MIERARSYLGVPYRHQGRSRLGIDCVGLVLVVGAELEVLPADFISNNYGRLPKDELVEKTSQFCERIEAPEPGCLVLIKWPNEKRPGHSGIIAGETIVHAYSTAQRVVEHGYRMQWVRWTDSFWRLPGVIYG